MNDKSVSELMAAQSVDTSRSITPHTDVTMMAINAARVARAEAIAAMTDGGARTRIAIAVAEAAMIAMAAERDKGFNAQVVFDGYMHGLSDSVVSQVASHNEQATHDQLHRLVESFFHALHQMTQDRVCKAFDGTDSLRKHNYRSNIPDGGKA